MSGEESTRGSLTDLFEPGARVFVAAMTGEPALLQEQLLAQPEAAREVEFISVQFPGIGNADYLATHAQARQCGFFMTASLREGMRQRRASLHALDYTGIAQYLQSAAPFDIAVAQLSEPDAHGWCSTGPSADFLPLVWQRARQRVGQINPLLPPVANGFKVHLSELSACAHAARALPVFQETPANVVAQSIGTLVASLIRHGDTLQFGIGSIPLALSSALTHLRRLRLHTGMISPAARVLDEAGALDPQSEITCGVALGDVDFYRWAATHPRIRYCDVRTTHNSAQLAGCPRFHAINSAVEVDLFGQINAERSAGQLLAGAGGLPPFAQAALASDGGRLVICLPATAQKGRISRIVPSLSDQGLCTLPRQMADTIVTEYGIAEVRHLAMEERAQALIAIAAPEHRSTLAMQWQQMLNIL